MKKLIGNIVFYLILIMLVSIAVMAINAKRTGKQPSILGHKFFVVLTGSMEPTIKVGDLVIVKDVQPTDIKVGDVITFRSEKSNNVTTHRVKEIINENGIEFVTKGDANNIHDPNPVNEKLLVGKEVGVIPKVGKVMSFMQRNLIVIICAIIAIFSGSILLFSILKRKTT